MAVKSPEEKMDSMERSLWRYRVAFFGALVVIIGAQRYRIVGWLDNVETWASGVIGTSKY
ncbi:MAG: hypothetical protein KF745_06975 [Phycisphaeraceae bacterium]|nr:hypothetical protein [Phycisphaeraceae bacterium]